MGIGVVMSWNQWPGLSRIIFDPKGNTTELARQQSGPQRTSAPPHGSTNTRAFQEGVNKHHFPSALVNKQKPNALRPRMDPAALRERAQALARLQQVYLRPVRTR